jgi:hypothetical protein
MKAQAENDTELAQLLDFAKVRPAGNTFGLEMAVPLDVIQKQLAFCREAQEPLPATESPEAASGPSEVAH